MISNSHRRACFALQTEIQIALLTSTSGADCALKIVLMIIRLATIFGSRQLKVAETGGRAPRKRETARECSAER